MLKLRVTTITLCYCGCIIEVKSSLGRLSDFWVGKYIIDIHTSRDANKDSIFDDLVNYRYLKII